MNLPPPRRLASHVQAPLDVPRINRLWDKVAKVRARSGSRHTIVFALAAAAVVLLGVFGWMRMHPGSSGGAPLVAQERPGSMTLPDGSQVRVGESSSVRLDRAEAGRVEVTLDVGEAVFDVRHDPSRVFVVHVGAFDVVDVGTRFRVARAAAVVSVSVEQGRVEVRDRDGDAVRSLGAGESWTSVEPPPAQTAAATAEPPPPPAASPAPLLAPPTPKELLETANAARLKGDAREAATRYDLLRKRYRNDSRAGLAAFELGRIRLDSLGDPPGAVEAFDDAIALSPNASFREDAEARRIDALEAAGNHARCISARDGYLSRYPGGLHATVVSTRCR